MFWRPLLIALPCVAAFFWALTLFAQAAGAHEFQGVWQKPPRGEKRELAVPDQIGPQARVVVTLTGTVPDLSGRLPALPALVIYPSPGQVCGCSMDPELGWQCACDPPACAGD